MTNFKKSVISILLSALLVSTTAIPIFAVEDSDGGVDTTSSEDVFERDEDDDYDPWAESESTDEDSDSDVSEEDIPEVVDEESDETLEPVEESEESEEHSETVDESSKESEVEDSKIEDSETGVNDSKPEESEESSETSKTITEIKTGPQTIKVTIDFGVPYAAASDVAKMVYYAIDYTHIKCSLLSEDKKTVIKAFNITDKMLKDDITVSGVTVDFDVPDWGKSGLTYYLRAENLPSIYDKSVQDIPVVCSIIKAEDNDVPDNIKINYDIDYVSGVTNPVVASLNLKAYNTAIFVYDKAMNIMPKVPITVHGYNSDEVLVYETTVKTGQEGVALLTIPTDVNIETVGLSVDAILNDSFVSGEKLFPFKEMAILTGTNAYYLQADTESFLLDYDDEYNKLPTGNLSEVDFRYNYDNIDTMLFRETPVYVGVYLGVDVIQNLMFDKDKTSANAQLIEGYKYTFSAIDTPDYELSISPSTFVANADTSVNVVATPQLFLTIINESNGIQSKAHFEIVGYDKEFNELSHTFAINSGSALKIRNIDTDEIFEVILGSYKNTTINIANGDIQEDGYVSNDNILPSDFDNTNTSSGTGAYNDVLTVPKTGDIIVGVLMILCALTGFSYLGYLYFKRKGKISNESKSKK